MTIFDYLKQIFIEKNSNVSLDHYVPYMVNRWLSFINPTVCETINQFNSKILLENKDLHYKTMLAAFPKLKTIPKIVYEKKQSINPTDSEININKSIAQAMELSEREIESLFNLKSLL